MWFAIALLLLTLLLYLHLDSPSIQIDTKVGESSIFFHANRNRVLFPNECVVVRWQVEQIKAVYLNQQGQIGSGEQESCTFNAVPILRVEFTDGSSAEYPLAIERLYQNPVVLLLLISFVLSSGLFAYRLVGIPGLLAIVMIAFFGPMLRNYANLNGDFITHTFFAKAARDSGNFNFLPPQFLFHLLTIEVSSVIPSVSLETAGFLVTLGAYVLCGIAVYHLLRHLTEGREPGFAHNGMLAGLALVIMLSGPVAFFTPPAPVSALVQFNAYHSPTIGLLKPFAVALFLLLLKRLGQPDPRGYWLTTGIVLLTVLSTLAKPSYTLTIVPMTALLIALSFVKLIRIPRLALIIGIMIPAIIVLGWQYLFLYGTQAQSTVYNSTEPAKIVFAPLELYLKWWNTPWYWVLPELVLSFLFPLTVYAAYLPQARRNFALNLAWGICLIGVSLSYLFIERPRESDGNLVWSGQITLFILFGTSAGFWLKQKTGSWRDWRFGLCLLVLFAHLASHLSLLLGHA